MFDKLSVVEDLFYSDNFYKNLDRIAQQKIAEEYKKMKQSDSEKNDSEDSSGYLFGTYSSLFLKEIDVLMMCGIPGGGKTTWITQYFDQNIIKNCHQDTDQSAGITEGKITNFEIFSPDTILLQKYNYEWSPQRAEEAWAESYQKFGSALLSKHQQTKSQQTKPQQKTKKTHIHETTIPMDRLSKKGQFMTDSKKDLDVEKILIWDATFLQSIQRSAILHLSKGMKLRVGCVFIDTDLEICLERNRQRDRKPVPEDRIQKMYQSLHPPSIEEGFDVIFRFQTRYR